MGRRVLGADGLVEAAGQHDAAPAARFLPGLPPAYRDVTVRHLLEHTSGIPRDLRDGQVSAARETSFGAAGELLASRDAVRFPRLLMAANSRCHRLAPRAVGDSP